LKGGFSTSYTIKKSGNGIYAFVLNGSVTLNEQTLFKRDAMGIWEVDKIEIEATTDSELLLIDVPMVA
jgi:redox-sensitive bicupin YhaK (pirin superfamily)